MWSMDSAAFHSRVNTIGAEVRRPAIYKTRFWPTAVNSGRFSPRLPSDAKGGSAHLALVR